MKSKEKEDFPIPFSVSNYLIWITKIDYRFLGSGMKSYPCSEKHLRKSSIRHGFVVFVPTASSPGLLAENGKSIQN